MIYVFLGKDFNVVNARIDDLINKLNISNIIKYDLTDDLFDDVLNEVNYVDLFNEKKLVIVSNFSFKSLTEEEEKRFIRYVENMSDNVIIIRCIDASVDERKKLIKLLKEKCKIENIEGLDYRNLHQYIKNMFTDAGIYTDFYKIKKILDLCEYDPDYTISEVNKMLIYKKGDNELTDKDIDDVISKNNEKEIYNFTESIMKKDIKGSLNSFKILDSSKADPAYLVNAIAGQFRLLSQLKYVKPGLNEEAIARELGVNKVAVIHALPYVRNYSDEEIMDLLYKLSNCDMEIKVYGKDGDYVIEKFIMTYTLH